MMNKGFVDGIDFFNLAAEKYWAPTKNVNIKELVKNAIYSNEYIGSRKVDGHWSMLIKDDDGDLMLRGRAKSVKGYYLDKINWVPHLKGSFNELPNGTVLLGELFFNGDEGSKRVTTILGCLAEKAIQRQKDSKYIDFYCFDCLAFDGKSIMDKSIEERTDFTNIKNILSKDSNIYYAKFYKGAELEDKIAEYLNNGFEGVVLQLKSGVYEPGKRPARKSIKVKKELKNEIDCFLTGNYKTATWEYSGKEIKTWQYWFDKRNNKKISGILYEDFINGLPIEPITKGAFYGWAGSIELGVYDENKNIVPIAWCSNITEEVKEGIISSNSEYAFKVVKANAMLREEDSGMFRHFKIMEWREDISAEDCAIDKIGG